MFWKFNLMTTNIDTLLDKEDVTLHELLDEDEVLQECKAQNRRLVDFIVRPEHMLELVNLITREPPDDTDEKIKYKYPNSACELLTSDVAQITAILAGDETEGDGLIPDIYAFMEKDAPLNPLLASFVSKVMGLLIGRKSSKMLEFLQSRDDFVGHLLHHLGTSAIMDLLLRLITCIESQECRTNCMTWLNEQRLIQKLVAMIDPACDEEKHCNASQSLCDIIRLSREQMSQLQERADTDPLLSAIECQDTVTELLHHMFGGERTESVLVSGLAVIQTLLEFRKIGAEGGQEQMTLLDAERLAVGVSSTLLALTPHLKDLNELLLNPPKQHYSNMPTTLGTLEPPLGNVRLQITRMMATLLLTNTHSVNVELASLGTITTLLDLYFKYLWNNFLHTQVEACILTILNNAPAETTEGKTDECPLLHQLFTEVKIIDKIMEKWEDNEEQQSRPGGHRKGYMGHLTRMANHIGEVMDKGTNADRIKEIYKELPESTREKWEAFVSGTLAETNKQNTVELVSSQTLQSSSEDDDPDFRDIPFPQDNAVQQTRRTARLAFSDYQLQQMTSNFIDQFGFNADEFTEQEERDDAPFNDRISAISFDISTTEERPSAATLFEQACNERLQHFEEADSDEDLWEEKELTFPQSSESRESGQPSKVSGSKAITGAHGDDGNDEDSEGSSDSEEDLPSPAIIKSATSATAAQPDTTTTASTAGTEKMEVDSSENWANFEEMNLDSSSVAPIAMETTSAPWEGKANVPPQSETWAKFGDTGINSTSEASATEEGWANFTSFQEMDSSANNLSVTETDPRSSSPIAMETNESVPNNSRTAAYLVSSSPADLATEVTEAKPSTEDKTPSSLASADTSQGSNKDELKSEAADSTTAMTPAASSGSPTASTRDEPRATAISTTSNEEESAPTMPPETPRGGTNEGAPVPDSTNGAVPERLAPTEETPSDGLSIAEASQEVEKPPLPVEDFDDSYDDDDDDLSDNFNFLASAGLMKSCGDDDAATANSTAAGAEAAAVPTSSTPANREEKSLETIRAQAREALQDFTDTTMPSSTQNGPV